MTDTTTIKTPAMDRLAAEEETLLAQVHEYRRSREVYYDGFNLAEVKKTYAERQSMVGSKIVAVKASASKAYHVAALARYDMEQSDLKVRLTALRRAAAQEEDIIDQANQARTVEMVAAAREGAVEDLLAKSQYTPADGLADLAYLYERAFQIAGCWEDIRNMLAEGESDPVSVLRKYREYVQGRVINVAQYGIVRSSSMTSNLLEEAKMRAMSEFLDSTKFLAREIEVG